MKPGSPLSSMQLGGYLGGLRTGLRPTLHGRPVLPKMRLRPEKATMDRGGEGRYLPSPRCASCCPHSPFAQPAQMPRPPPRVVYCRIRRKFSTVRFFTRPIHAVLFPSQIIEGFAAPRYSDATNHSSHSLITIDVHALSAY